MNEPDECVAYAEHLHHEHSRLNRLLLGIGEEISRLGLPDTDRSLRAQIETRLTDLRDQLKTHFAEEEDGGCLEEAVTRCPSLATDAKAIFEEHAVLDRLLCAVLVQVSDPAATTVEMQGSWKKFYKKIQAHEAAETRLLQMAFGAETADHDVEGEA